jgi:hypothetical protein
MFEKQRGFTVILDVSIFILTGRSKAPANWPELEEFVGRIVRR